MARQANGWWATPSPDSLYSYAGNRECWLTDETTGREWQIHPETRCMGGGWLDERTVVIALGEDDATIIAHQVDTGTERVLYSHVALSRWPLAGRGHVGWTRAGGSAYWEGVPLSWQSGGFYGHVDGTLMAVRGTGDYPQPLNIFIAGNLSRSVPVQTACVEVCCDESRHLVGYGYNWHPTILDVISGEQRDASVTPDGKEGPPWLCDGWVATTRERPAQVLLRPIGDTADAIVIDVGQSVVGVRFASCHGGQAFLVLAWGDQGEPFRIIVPKDALRVAPGPSLPEEPPAPPPVEPVPPAPIFPMLDRHVWMGCYKNPTGRLPGDCYYFETNGTRKGGIYRRADHTLLAEPVGDAVEGDTWDWGGERIVGVQAFVPVPGPLTAQGCLDAMRRRIAEVLLPVEGKPAIFIPQATDRRSIHANDQWPAGDAGLSLMQQAVYEALRDRPNIRAVIWFALEREGGIDTYPGERAWIDAICAAVPPVSEPPLEPPVEPPVGPPAVPPPDPTPARGCALWQWLMARLT